MNTKTRRPGRPATRVMPPRIDATPEELARAIMQTPPRRGFTVPGVGHEPEPEATDLSAIVGNGDET